AGRRQRTVVGCNLAGAGDLARWRDAIAVPLSRHYRRAVDDGHLQMARYLPSLQWLFQRLSAHWPRLAAAGRTGVRGCVRQPHRSRIFARRNTQLGWHRLPHPDRDLPIFLPHLASAEGAYSASATHTGDWRRRTGHAPDQEREWQRLGQRTHRWLAGHRRNERSRYAHRGALLRRTRSAGNGDRPPSHPARVHCVAIESVTENRADLQPAVGHHRRYCLGAGYFFDAITRSFGEGTERAAIDYAVGIAARRIGNAGAGKNTDGQVDCIVDA